MLWALIFFLTLIICRCFVHCFIYFICTNVWEVTGKANRFLYRLSPFVFRDKMLSWCLGLNANFFLKLKHFNAWTTVRLHFYCLELIICDHIEFVCNYTVCEMRFVFSLNLQCEETELGSNKVHREILHFLLQDIMWQLRFLCRNKHKQLMHFLKYKTYKYKI